MVFFARAKPFVLTLLRGEKVITEVVVVTEVEEIGAEAAEGANEEGEEDLKVAMAVVTEEAGLTAVDTEIVETELSEEAGMVIPTEVNADLTVVAMTGAMATTIVAEVVEVVEAVEAKDTTTVAKAVEGIQTLAVVREETQTASPKLKNFVNLILKRQPLVPDSSFCRDP